MKTHQVASRRTVKFSTGQSMSRTSRTSADVRILPSCKPRTDPPSGTFSETNPARAKQLFTVMLAPATSQVLNMWVAWSSMPGTDVFLERRFSYVLKTQKTRDQSFARCQTSAGKVLTLTLCEERRSITHPLGPRLSRGRLDRAPTRDLMCFH
jgi:hypothetical protein